MARITNYGELKQAVAIRMHRSLVGDLDAVIDQLVQNVEGILTTLSSLFYNTNIIFLTDLDRLSTDSTNYILPADVWRVIEVVRDPVGTFAFTWDKGSKVQKSLTVNNVVDNFRAGQASPVEGYTLSPDLNLLRFNYVPDIGTSMEMYYEQTLIPLILDTDSNTFLESSPETYLFGVCGEVASWLQDMELEEYYRSRFDQEVERINERTRIARDKGPVQIQGASQWI